MPSETGNRVSDGILFVISKRGSLNIPTLFLPFWGSQRPLQNSPKSPKCLGGNLGDFGEFCKGLGLSVPVCA
ncbi:hypothetical protein [Neisseria meningitidis]|uniref:hypothetical protein n=1 Tax=Neisseria meningitidis TaxID=487 RepID=UPI000FCCC4D7|nr:hypothetical protein [Neisseria meningitidis]